MDVSEYSVSVTIKLHQVTVIFLSQICTRGFYFSKITFQIHALDEYGKRTRKGFAVVSLVLVMQADQNVAVLLPDYTAIHFISQKS
jgi:hypothetical protein